MTRRKSYENLRADRGCYMVTRSAPTHAEYIANGLPNAVRLGRDSVGLAEGG